MSGEARKNCRTQGKYSDKSQCFEDRSRKSGEKRNKVSPTAKESQEKKFLKRKSDGSKEGASTSFNSESESPVSYQENSEHNFSELEEARKPIEIKSPGKHILSVTENGESSVLFNPNFYEEIEAWELMDYLMDNTKWNKKNIVIHGVEYPQPRLVAWYGPFPYSYSGTTLEPAKMPDCVLGIKNKVEQYLSANGINVELNSVLLNLYRNNKDSVSWHSDDEITMGVCPTIASVSLGETRKFEMRRKMKYSEDESTSDKVDEYFAHLNHGSLIVMDGCMQKDWQHRVPKEYHDRDERINLTFRTVYELKNISPYSDIRSKNLSIDRETIKKSHKNKINFDEENFPPLKNDAKPVWSNIAYSPHEKTEDISSPVYKDDNFNGRRDSGSSQSKHELNFSDDTDGSPEEYSIKSQSSNRTPSNINESEEEWVVKTPHYKRIPLKMNDRINASQEEYPIKSQYSNRTPSNINESEGERVVKTSRYTRIPSKMNASQEEYPIKSQYSYRPPSRRNDKINESEEEWVVQSPNFNRTPLKGNDTTNASVEKNIENTPLKKDGINRSDKECITKPSFNRQTPLEREKINRSEERGVFKHSYSRTSLKRDKVITADEVGVIEPSDNEKGTILNNLNEEKNNEKIEMQNKNLQVYDSSLSNNNCMNDGEKLGKDKNFSINERRNVSSYCPINSMPKKVHEVNNEPKCNRINNWRPNVEAKEFIPISANPVPLENNPHGEFQLENLLDYNTDLMPRKALLDHAQALKFRILDQLSEFEHSVREELEVLCKITDGNQTDRNQRIIIKRMRTIIERASEGFNQHCDSQNYPKSYGSHKQTNHRNQSHYSERKYNTYSRTYHHRH